MTSLRSLFSRTESDKCRAGWHTHSNSNSNSYARSRNAQNEAKKAREKQANAAQPILVSIFFWFFSSTIWSVLRLWSSKEKLEKFRGPFSLVFVFFVYFLSNYCYLFNFIIVGFVFVFLFRFRTLCAIIHSNGFSKFKREKKNIFARFLSALFLLLFNTKFRLKPKRKEKENYKIHQFDSTRPDDCSDDTERNFQFFDTKFPFLLALVAVRLSADRRPFNRLSLLLVQMARDNNFTVWWYVVFTWPGYSPFDWPIGSP